MATDRDALTASAKAYAEELDRIAGLSDRPGAVINRGALPLHASLLRHLADALAACGDPDEDGMGINELPNEGYPLGEAWPTGDPDGDSGTEGVVVLNGRRWRVHPSKTYLNEDGSYSTTTPTLMPLDADTDEEADDA